MVVVNIHYLTIVEHLLVNDVEIWAVGAHQHTLGLRNISAFEGDLHLDVVEHADGVALCVVAHRVDDQRADSYSTHGALHLDCCLRSSGETSRLICFFIINEWHILDFLVFSYRRLAWHDGADAIFRKAVILCGIANY